MVGTVGGSKWLGQFIGNGARWLRGSRREAVAAAPIALPNGQRVRVGKTHVRYLAAGEPVEVDEPIRATAGRYIPDLYFDHPRVRRILIRWRAEWPLMLGYLHWGDGTDLCAVDNRVTAGEVVEADFAGAIEGRVTRYRHHACGTLFEILPSGGDVWFDDDLERRRAHPQHRICPVCGVTLFAPVYEFLEIVSVEDEGNWRSEMIGRIALRMRALAAR